MASFSFSDDFEEQLKKQFERTVEIPDGLTEDEAVAHVIEAYRNETGAELSDDAVRPEVRAKMAGRERT